MSVIGASFSAVGYQRLALWEPAPEFSLIAICHPFPVIIIINNKK